MRKMGKGAGLVKTAPLRRQPPAGAGSGLPRPVREPNMKLDALAKSIKTWGRELGFQQTGITGIDLPEDERHLLDWLAQGRHGEMAYMARHGNKRSRPALLRPGTLRVIAARMDYLPPGAKRRMKCWKTGSWRSCPATP